MGLSRTVSGINGDFCRKSEIAPTPRIFNAPAERVPLRFCNGGSVQKLEPCPYTRWRKEFDDMCIPFESVTDRQTDGQICHNNIAFCMHWHAVLR